MNVAFGKRPSWSLRPTCGHEAAIRCAAGECRQGFPIGALRRRGREGSRETLASSLSTDCCEDVLLIGQNDRIMYRLKPQRPARGCYTLPEDLSLGQSDAWAAVGRRAFLEEHDAPRLIHPSDCFNSDRLRTSWPGFVLLHPAHGVCCHLR